MNILQPCPVCREEAVSTHGDWHECSQCLWRLHFDSWLNDVRQLVWWDLTKEDVEDARGHWDDFLAPKEAAHWLKVERHRMNEENVA